MAYSARLELRQSQALVMTPQLQQAIKLLQLSNLELNAFVEAELERNPLLESEADRDSIQSDTLDKAASDDASQASDNQDWVQGSVSDAADVLDTSYENIAPDASSTDYQDMRSGEDGGFGEHHWSSVRTNTSATSLDDYNLEGFVAEAPTLKAHLSDQLGVAISAPAERMIAHHLIDMVDEAGYLRGDLAGLADRLGAERALVEQVLVTLQKFEPAGVFARSLAECLALQLKERNRYDPLIAGLIDNLGLLASHNFSALKKLLKVDQAELSEMIAEIKQLNPKPGLKYGSVVVQPVVPDVIVKPRSDGGWQVELNSDTLPKVLVNQSYFATVNENARSDTDREYLNNCLQTANWLAKSLDQRARTILKVSIEIIRQQDGFFAHGIQHLRPLNLKTVADAISMHESTVSRVTSNKYMQTPRGIFELKYFFTSAIASASGDSEAYSSEAVRHRIRHLIDTETIEKILSDDKIVALLKTDGIDIARRTVAKYREAMNIASSVQRRREKKLAARTREFA